MRKKTQISLRIEWIETIATLITSLQLEVMNAVIAYLTDGTVTKIDNIDAAEMFMGIKNDIDERAEQRGRRMKAEETESSTRPGAAPGADDLSASGAKEEAAEADEPDPEGPDKTIGRMGDLRADDAS